MHFQNISLVETALTVQAAAYAAADLIGGKISIIVPRWSIRNKVKGAIVSARLVDQAAQAVAYHLTVFNANPSNTTFTENSALDVADADMTKIIGHISFPTASQIANADNLFGEGTFVGNTNFLPFELATGASTLYAALRTTGTPTYAATTDLSLLLGIATLARD